MCHKRAGTARSADKEHKTMHTYNNDSLLDIDCSVYQYLVFVERACPIPNNADALFAETILSQEAMEHLLPKATVANNFDALNDQLQQCGKVCNLRSSILVFVAIKKKERYEKDQYFAA